MTSSSVLSFVAAFSGLGELVSWPCGSVRALTETLKIKQENLCWGLRLGMELGNAKNTRAAASGQTQYLYLMIVWWILMNLKLTLPMRWLLLHQAIVTLGVRLSIIATVTLLLHRGAEINMIGDKYGTALSAFWGPSDIVTLLLDRGADVNCWWDVCRVLPCADPLWEHTERVTLLLDQGADINIIGGIYTAHP
ncbi:hypothetical protein L211DRAFT_287759 [Terfezia boudieri ATCC MYA-4762]|uniref:Ankyrin n=1 Tax=Terfezia boudieri ATCC MYA-4762 TaxID=1051890 RepID=A0A3N4LKT5_9PEZI|nr:hypothetical protein L211DRAFT_287759 [Terfezia boudieri ATCC MYA-4762]